MSKKRRFDTRPKGKTHVRSHERKKASGVTTVREHLRRNKSQMSKTIRRIGVGSRKGNMMIVIEHTGSSTPEITGELKSIFPRAKSVAPTTPTVGGNTVMSFYEIPYYAEMTDLERKK